MRRPARRRTISRTSASARRPASGAKRTRLRAADSWDHVSGTGSDRPARGGRCMGRGGVGFASHRPRDGVQLHRQKHHDVRHLEVLERQENRSEAKQEQWHSPRLPEASDFTRAISGSMLGTPNPPEARAGRRRGTRGTAVQRSTPTRCRRRSAGTGCESSGRACRPRSEGEEVRVADAQAEEWAFVRHADRDAQVAFRTGLRSRPRPACRSRRTGPDLLPRHDGIMTSAITTYTTSTKPLAAGPGASSNGATTQSARPSLHGNTRAAPP